MRQCAICGRGSILGGKRKLLRGHYNPTSTSRKYPNLQRARLPLRGTSGQAKVSARGGSASGGNGVTKLICTKCLKTLHKKS